MGETLLTSKLTGERLELAAGGSWTAAHASELESVVDGVAGQAAKANNVSIDMAGCASSTPSAPGCWSA